MLKGKINPERFPSILAKYDIDPNEPYMMVNVVGDKATVVFKGTPHECLQWLSDNCVGIPDDERLYTHMMSEEDYATLDIKSLPL